MHLLVAAALAIGAGCEDDRCDVGAAWCEGNAVKRCRGSYDCTLLHCTDGQEEKEETDCGSLGAFCLEFAEGSGESTAFCSVTEQPCPDGIASFCVGEVLAVCHPAYDYPEWIVDCRESQGQSCVQHGAEATCE